MIRENLHGIDLKAAFSAKWKEANQRPLTIHVCQVPPEEIGLKHPDTWNEPMRANLGVYQSGSFRRLRLFMFCLFITGVVLPLGCNRGVSDSELGDIHYSLPKIPGAESPTPLPPPFRAETKRSEEEPESEKEISEPVTPPADATAAIEQLEEKAASDENSATEEAD